MMRYDYEYIDMAAEDDGAAISIPLDEFRAKLLDLEAYAEDKDGSNLRVTVDSDRDILLEFDRPETTKEREAREERERRNRDAETERKFRRQQQKWDELRRLAGELGVTINE